MRRVTLRSLWAHKRRLLSTVVAVVLGVAFMAGTFIVSTTLDQSFDDLFADTVEHVDAVVQGPVLFNDLLLGDERANLPQEVADDVAAVDGVAAAVGRVSSADTASFDRVLGADGEAIGGVSGDTVLESWIDADALSPYRLADGRAPRQDGEVVLDLGAAEDGDLAVGDVVTIVSKLGAEDFTLVGTFSFGTAKSVGGAVTAGLTLADAQRLVGEPGVVQTVWVAADEGVSQSELARRVTPVLADGAEVITGAEAVEQLSANRQTGGGFAFLETALAVFGAIALVVGVFVISNTFSILVAQRTKELALLRALGASRAQVLGSVLLEAAIVGAVAAVLGLGAGMLLAEAVTAGLDAAGASLPSTALVVEPSTILLSLVVGVAVTLLAALVPAIRATRVPPLAAIRDVAIDRSNLSRARVAGGAVALAAGIWFLSSAWRDPHARNSLLTAGVGAGLAVVGFLVVGPVVAGRSIRTLGTPLPRLLGVRGKLATQNAARSPRRTSATASAIVIGVALVVFVTMFATSATRTVNTVVDRSFRADFVVNAQSAGGLTFLEGMPRTVLDTVAKVDGVDVLSPVGFGSLELAYPDGDRATHFLTSLDPATVDEVMRPRMVTGELHDLTDDGVVVDFRIVDAHHLALGDRITVVAPGGGSADLEIQGISDDQNLLNYLTITRDTYVRVNPQAVDEQLMGTLEPGADLATVMAAVSDAVADLPGLEVLDRDGFAGSIKDEINAYVTLLYALLLLSVVTALVGIANTLSLTIQERLRELGLLRAVGMDRAGVRSTVRWEAGLISVLGAGVGIAVGAVVSVGLLKAMRSWGLEDIAFPVAWMALILVATAVLGTLASVRPARHAARLSILDAIASE